LRGGAEGAGLMEGNSGWSEFGESYRQKEREEKTKTKKEGWGGRAPTGKKETPRHPSGPVFEFQQRKQPREKGVGESFVLRETIHEGRGDHREVRGNFSEIQAAWQISDSLQSTRARQDKGGTSDGEEGRDNYKRWKRKS